MTVPDPPNTSPVAGLLEAEAYAHSVEHVHVRETHISWILLTGEFAYKIKKPVNLGFVDFSTLDRRRFFCEEEVRLNRRFADDLYLDVVPITRTPHGLQVGGGDEPVEYSVRMRQFDESCLLSQLLADGNLERSYIDELAAVVAAAHSKADRADEQSEWGSPAQVGEPAAENFCSLKPLVDDPGNIKLLDELADWTRRTQQQLENAFTARQHDGFIRECHGDLHLGNVVLWRERVTPFDCIEFNPAFRWIDVMNEVAFVVMDLDEHERSDLAWRFLNAYLERTGDYQGLRVLPFYLVYRAMVRAKVDALRLNQSGLAVEERRQLADEWHGYLDLAQRYTVRRSPSLAITHGLSGSGKTTGTQTLLERQGAIRVRSDVERKRLFDMGDSQAHRAPVEEGIYSPAASARTYDRLAELARGVIHAGYAAVIDATFLRHDQRARFCRLAEELKVPFSILAFEADEHVLRDRIQRRSVAGNDASDATLEVLERQLQACEPLTNEERALVVND